MSRTIAAAVLFALLGFATTVAAADAEPSAAEPTPSIADAGLPPLAGDVDWTLPLLHIGAPKRGAVLPVLYVSLAGLNAYDAYSTSVGVAAGAREANLLMGGLASNPAAFWATKGAVTAGSIVIAEQLWRKHRRVAAISMMAVSNGIMAMVAANNARVLGRQ